MIGFEVEVKVPCDDLEGVRKVLTGMGAEDMGEDLQEDVYLTHPCRDFGERDEALRLRTSRGRWRLTYKGPKVDPTLKIREEIELDIDPDIERVLEKLGFHRRIVVRKQRRIMVLGDIEISLDRVEDLGDFLELEYKGGSVDEGRMEILALMERLDLRGSERRSYLELVLEREGDH